MQTLDTKRKDIVNFFLKKGMLVSNDLLECVENEETLSEIYKLVENKPSENITVISKKIKDLLIHKQPSVERTLSHEESSESKKTEPEGNVKIVFSYNKAPKKREANDFIHYFNNRYDAI